MASRTGHITRTLLLLLLLAGVLAFLFPRNHPLLSWRAIQHGDFSTLKELPQKLPHDIEPRAVTAYRWQDKQGVWHLSNEAPPEGVEYERVTVDPDANLLPAPKDDGVEEKTLSAKDLLQLKKQDN